MVIDECKKAEPELVEITSGHYARCIKVKGYSAEVQKLGRAEGGI
jgi:hypothetical protein